MNFTSSEDFLHDSAWGPFLNCNLFWFGFVISFFSFRSQGKEATHGSLGMKDTEQPLASAQQSLPPQLVEKQMANAQLFLPQPPPVPGKAEQGKKEAFQAAKPSAMYCCCIRHQKDSNKCSTFDKI